MPEVADYRPHLYPPFAVTADLVVMTVRRGRLNVLLVERGTEPFRGRLALPGGFVRPEESLVDGAYRELVEETGLGRKDVVLAQLGAYGDPGRDPRMRVVSVAWAALAADLPEPVAGTDAAAARWLAVEDLADGDAALAFDHATIVADGVRWVRAEIESTPLAAAFCPPEFTVNELRQVYEAIWGARVDARNFHRKVTSVPDLLVPVEGRRAATGGRSAQVYRLGAARRIEPPLRQPSQRFSSSP